MAKGFPYFKFIATEWLTGDIVFEDFELQGIFINICALYWHRDGHLTLDDVFKRLKSERVSELVDRFISVNNGCIAIKFLDEQLQDAGYISKVNSENGKKGGRPKTEKKPTALRPITDRKPKKSKEDIEEDIDIELNKEEEIQSSLISSETLISSLRSDEKIKMQVIRSYAWMEDEYNTALNDFIFRCETEGSISGRTYADFATHFLNFARRNRDTFKPKPKGKANSANEMLSQAARLAEKIKQRQ